MERDCNAGKVIKDMAEPILSKAKRDEEGNMKKGSEMDVEEWIADFKEYRLLSTVWDENKRRSYNLILQHCRASQV
eukprot:CAMPEP_0184440562 /NCGR_PEP_ID=MMETSP0738-20130409/755630_1 /TAXON_ID=385413 /ORGANISM="Thalassiosira miniscula, Strain CCMP1093" /LENGTH=75 /DNA_ID=CAMNT_0026808457 /DNA_START=1079 /DNA_END=1303 /DNA_ORIENTATION=+